eukprot:1653611-Rhodomonas_salina.2
MDTPSYPDPDMDTPNYPDPDMDTPNYPDPDMDTPNILPRLTPTPAPAPEAISWGLGRCSGLDPRSRRAGAGGQQDDTYIKNESMRAAVKSKLLLSQRACA